MGMIRKSRKPHLLGLILLFLQPILLENPGMGFLTTPLLESAAGDDSRYRSRHSIVIL